MSDALAQAFVGLQARVNELEKRVHALEVKVFVLAAIGGFVGAGAPSALNAMFGG